MFGIFGRGRTPPTGSRLREAVRTIYPELVLDVDPVEAKRALEAWAWLNIPKADVAMVSAFGDIFFEVEDEIVMLDTLDGQTRTVAQSVDSFMLAIRDNDYRDDLLSDVWVQAAGRAGLKLAEGECFDWAVPPVLGGQCRVEAITKSSFVVKVDVAGQIHRQVQHLPPGTPIGQITITD